MNTRSIVLGLLGLVTSPALAGCSGGVTEEPTGGGGGPTTIILDGGGPIPQPPDGESACPAPAKCNYQSNAGCAAQETCQPVSDTQDNIVPGCLPAGQGVSGTSCNGSAECGPGHVCAGKQCRKLCCGGDWTGCPSPAEHCFRNVTDALGVPTGAMVCLPVNNCDALVPASCGGDGTLTCQIIDPTGATTCFEEGTGAQGDPCPCKGGFICVNTGGSTTECRKLCKAVEGGGEPSCTAEEGVCVHYHRDPPGVGECTPYEND